MYQVTVVGYRGNLLFRSTGSSVGALQDQADAYPNGNASVRDDHTSDGAYQGTGNGRVVSVRENGVWVIPSSGC